MTIRLLIADDHQMIRLGLRAILADSEVEIVGEATSGRQAVAMTAQLQPDVVILDVRMEDGDGMAALTAIRTQDPAARVILFSTYDNPCFSAKALALGAAGYLLKTADRTTLLGAIRMVADGENLWSREELRRIHGALSTPRVAAEVDIPLTEREREVLVGVVQGLTNLEIGEGLRISRETVKEHVQHILSKIGMHDRTQAAVWAVRKGIA